MQNESVRLERLSVPALDEILGQPLPVLDDGFVRVIDYMGSDESIVQAARVSYGQGTRKRLEDEGLIRYLMRHQHTSPFEMCEIKLHVRVPMDCWRQWIRHRTANVNEYSTRYSIAIEAAQKTQPDQWRKQGILNRQGSSGKLDEEIGAQLSQEEAELHDRCRAVYRIRLDLGVAREQARKDLPLSTYTEAYWKIDLHNLLHFLALRLEWKAQQEIREYARVIGYDIVRRWCPITWTAFEDYRLNSLHLSRVEARILQLLASGKASEATAEALAAKLLQPNGSGFKPTLEGIEFEAKLKSLQMHIPWEEESR
jgi:thymidylate synthase (FAD)